MSASTKDEYELLDEAVVSAAACEETMEGTTDMYVDEALSLIARAEHAPAAKQQRAALKEAVAALVRAMAVLDA